ncbi:MAG: hypothetical protein V4712_16865 [Pseudomonadota bacterium]
MEAAENTGWMMLRDGLAHGGYVAWEAASDPPPMPGHRRLVPVFARLKDPGFGDRDLAGVIAASLALPDVLYAQHERDLLEFEATWTGTGWPPHEVRLVAWCPRALLAAVPAFWQVLHVGRSVLMPAAPSPDASLAPRVRHRHRFVPGRPVVAVIDDGIGFLNARFRADAAHTRVSGLWMQAAERVGSDPADGVEDVLCGRMLTGGGIDAMLASGGSEAEIYGLLNRALVPRTDRSGTNHRVAHGTHVMDLAGGGDFADGDPMSGLPLLAVQVPSAAIRDSSGRRLEGYVAQGIRWILAQVLQSAQGDGRVPVVVINLSLGSLAGPGDETAFLADWMRHEIARHARMAGGAEVRIVAAYGNARRQRLVARTDFRRAAPLHLDWRLLPDDHTPSFLELRVGKGNHIGLRVGLVPPVGSGLPRIDLDWPMAGEGHRLNTPQGPVAAIVSGQEADHDLLHLTLAPSAGIGPAALAPSGLWRIEVVTLTAEPVRLTARVQRDDTPSGYRILGRQSWLDHPDGWDWDDETRDFTAPVLAGQEPGCPVTREGTAVAFAGADHPSLYFVGAARPCPGQPGGYRASRYSASGAVHLSRPDESAGPSLAARGDDGMILSGLRAAGVLSGSVARISGTSAAAPQVTRRLALYFLTTPPHLRTAAAERLALLGPTAAGPLSPVLGAGVLRSGVPA